MIGMLVTKLVGMIGIDSGSGHSDIRSEYEAGGWDEYSRSEWD